MKTADFFGAASGCPCRPPLTGPVDPGKISRSARMEKDPNETATRAPATPDGLQRFLLNIELCGEPLKADVETTGRPGRPLSTWDAGSI